MSAFADALEARAVDPAGRRWLFVPEDQLTDAVGPLAREDPAELGIVVVENAWKTRLRPYHVQRLALGLANQRHFALEQAARGVAVRVVEGDAPFAHLLEPVARELGGLRVMRPAERELRADLAPLLEAGAIEEIRHEGWLTTRSQFEAAFDGGKRWKLDTFYRHVRRETGILMAGDAPAGGRFSFDAENRKPWRGEPEAPEPPRFEADAVTREAAGLVSERFPEHPGEIDLGALPATADDAERLWQWARGRCLEAFGPFQDAMSTRSSGLFHTRISALVNLHRLLPSRVLGDALALDVPLASREAFVRQVLGWREFVHHVHEASDGFRRVPGRRDPPVAERPGDGGWSRWRGREWKPPALPDALDGGARPSALGARGALPPAFWGEPSGLACLDSVVGDVWRESYGHHITRLMVLANLATLLGVSPRELTDWFWVAYSDAYDWVVEPNVLGMGTFALGPLFTTKPYVAAAAYVDRMSDYCAGCRFSPKRDCPLTPLYWDFVARHEKALADNPRMAIPRAGLGRRSPARRREDAATASRVRRTLAQGGELEP